ncbi:MAG: lytic transglycosylase domain-containing protein [Pseudomonadota bacterium]
MMTQVVAACLMLAAQTYSVPPAVLVGIHQVEGGKPGQAVGPNKNGTYDLGPMQINTLWIPELAEKWGVSKNTALQWVKNDPCTNMGVAAWILRNHMNETRDLGQAIAHYHSRTPKFGTVYRGKVVNAMRSKGLIRDEATR